MFLYWSKINVIIWTDVFQCNEWEPGVYTALHSIRDNTSISSETVNRVHVYLISELLTLPPVISG